jgi:hypothetical protein
VQSNLLLQVSHQKLLVHRQANGDVALKGKIVKVWGYLEVIAASTSDYAQTNKQV